jgi:hypothetical protein
LPPSVGRPRITEKPGQHFKNIDGEKAKEKAQIKSQGQHQSAYPLITIAERAAAAQKGILSLDLLARAGTHLVTDNLEDLAKNLCQPPRFQAILVAWVRIGRVLVYAQEMPSVFRLFLKMK